MNTKNLKAYAPKARSQFIEAIKKRAAQLGIYQDKIAEVQFEGGAAIIEGRAFTKKQGEQRKALERKLEEKSFSTHKERYDLFIREMAYTWFNRLAAIRYMELHDYLDHGFRVLSNPNGADSLPEILDHASDVVDTLDPDQKYLDKNHIIELQLAGNKEEELYRELLLGQCHRLYNIMPFMFEAVDDATELLLPDNLTKTDSILKGLVNEIPEEDWSEIEVIGWLYQFYISEHKDAVIGKVVKSEDIPAATQLFTPNWIVKYLVQNSLGRQWLAAYPESELKGKMEYYIEPAEQSDDVIKQLKAITPTSIDPEQIKVLDPAAGSGHILVEVYEVLREIYLERGYRLREIPELILSKNIYGLDIDDRAAQLAGFALMMKAREDDRRIFERMSQRVEDGEVALNVYSLQSTEGLDVNNLWQALNLEGNQKEGSTGGLFDGLVDAESFVQPNGVYKDYFELLQTLKSAFLQAKTLGSLIQIDKEHLQNLLALKELLQTKEKGSDPTAKQAASDLLPIVNQATILANQYYTVVANPPFIGGKGMNTEIKKFGEQNFSSGKSDLYSIFIERALLLGVNNSYLGFVTPYTWMFISSFESFRQNLLENYSIDSLVLPSYTSFFESAIVPLVTFTMRKGVSNAKGKFTELGYLGRGDEQPGRLIESIKGSDNYKLFEHTADDFRKIPGKTIAFWLTNDEIDVFTNNSRLERFAPTRKGMVTGKNENYVRFWFEVSYGNSFLDKAVNREETKTTQKKWVSYLKGGGFRKWYGNKLDVVDWENDGYSLQSNKHPKENRVWATNFNLDYIFKPNVNWGAVTSSDFSARYSDGGEIFDAGGSACFPSDISYYSILAFLNSSVCRVLLKALNPTLNFQAGNISNLPISEKLESTELHDLVKKVIDVYKLDWNLFERSWGFINSPLVAEHNLSKLSVITDKVLNNYKLMSNEALSIERKINSKVSDIYGVNVEDNLSLEKISLTANSSFRFKSKNIDTIKRQSLMLSELSLELISYSIGCMMGRYSLNQEGLVYAHSGNEGFKELSEGGTYQKFPADDDGIVPLASEDWLFGDDATTRFREFVKTVWGDEHLQENLEFVAESLFLNTLKPLKGENSNDTVRRYFSKQFYKDHCQTYKKRPIYWLFSSGKEKAFECLVYLHRYNEGTLARMRTEYVTPLMGKYDQQQSMLSEQIIEASNTEKRQIEKDLKSLEKKQAELRTFDEQLKHYAEMRITLDLDDGVKANYGKFGNLLADVKAIHGKAVK